MAANKHVVKDKYEDMIGFAFNPVERQQIWTELLHRENSQMKFRYSYQTNPLKAHKHQICDKVGMTEFKSLTSGAPKSNGKRPGSAAEKHNLTSSLKSQHNFYRGPKLMTQNQRYGYHHGEEDAKLVRSFIYSLSTIPYHIPSTSLSLLCFYFFIFVCLTLVLLC